MGLFSKDKPARLDLKNPTITSGFSTATYRPNQGTASYSLSAPLQQMRDSFYGGAQDQLSSILGDPFAEAAPTVDSIYKELELARSKKFNGQMLSQTKQSTQEKYRRRAEQQYQTRIADYNQRKAAWEKEQKAQMPDYAGDLNTYGQNLFSQGTDLLTAAQTRQDPMDYYNKQQALLAPNRAVEEARLADTLFKSGRTGAAVGYGQGYLNPEQFALLKAREEANAGMMLGSEDRVRTLQNQDIAQATGFQSLGLNYQDSANTLAMRPYQNAQTLFGVGTGIENLGQQDLINTLGVLSPMQFKVDSAIQANKTARQGGGGFLGGIGGGLLNAGLNYATGGISGAVQGALSGSPAGLFSSLGTAFNNFAAPNLFSGFSGTSPSSGGMGFGNMVSAMNSSYSPSNTMMGMGGYQAPSSFGGGTIAPRFY